MPLCACGRASFYFRLNKPATVIVKPQKPMSPTRISFSQHNQPFLGDASHIFIKYIVCAMCNVHFCLFVVVGGDNLIFAIHIAFAKYERRPTQLQNMNADTRLEMGRNYT